MPDKEGHIMCGFCCDMRRAVFITNAILIIFHFIFMIIVGIAYREAKKGEIEVDMDDAKRALTGSLTVSFLGFLFCGLAIYGAKIYNMYMVGLNALFMFITWITVTAINVAASRSNDGFDYGWFAVVFTMFLYGIFIYPHVVFVHEVRNGTMEERFYYKEEWSCCCV